MANPFIKLETTIDRSMFVARSSKRLIGLISSVLSCAVVMLGCASQPAELACPISHAQSQLSDQEPFASELKELSRLQRQRFANMQMAAADKERLKELTQKYRIRGAEATDTPSPEVVKIAKRNAIILAQYAAAEAPYRASLQGSVTPDRCIALSGGGSRSAFVNLGVLFAHEQRKESPFDVYSAVSGGGYALGWYVNQRLRDSRQKSAFGFGEPSPARRIQHSLVDLSIAAPTSIGCVLHSLLRALLPTLSGSHDIPSNMCRDSYAAQIQLAYGVSGNRQTLDSALRKGKFGMPIWNWSVFPVSAGRVRSVDPHDTLAEVTPLGIGSDGLGFANEWPVSTQELSDIVAVSGAAADRVLDHMDASGSFRKPLIQFGGGGMITGACSRSDVESPSTSKELPHLTTQIYVSDGGEVDNLGLIPLVKRLCNETVVIDAEHDPHWVFEGLEVAQQRLRNLYGIHLKVEPHLEQILQETRGSKFERADGVEIHRAHEICERSPDYQHGCWYSRRATKTHYSATVGPIPLWLDGAIVWREPKIRYIKLGSNQGLERELYKRELEGAQHTRDSERESHKRFAAWWEESCSGASRVTCPFPQTPTANQQLSEAEARAYLQLGHGTYSEWLYPMRRDDWKQIPDVLRPGGLKGSGVNKLTN